jgi:hypothetical protein
LLKIDIYNVEPSKNIYRCFALIWRYFLFVYFSCGKFPSPENHWTLTNKIKSKIRFFLFTKFSLHFDWSASVLLLTWQFNFLRTFFIQTNLGTESTHRAFRTQIDLNKKNNANQLHLKNVYYLYSACSNPTNVVSVIVLSMIIGTGLDNGTAKFYRCVITQAISKTIA